MKKVSIVLFSAAFVFSQIGCGGKPAANNTSNNSNLSSPSATPSAVTNQNINTTNANVKQDIPVPTFTDANTAFTEGNKYFDANETEKSIDAYKQAVKLNPDLAEAYFKLGVAYALLENDKDVIPGLESDTPEGHKKKPQKISQKSGKSKDKPVRTKNSEKAFEQAVNAYKKILAKNPKDDVAQFNLGRSYNKLNEDDDAEKALRLAVKLKSDDNEYQAELGAVLSKQAKYDEAVKILKKLTNLEPDNSQYESLLEKAEAGKKRMDYGKPPETEKSGDTSGKGNRDKQNQNTPPKDKREPPPKIEKDIKVKP